MSKITEVIITCDFCNLEIKEVANYIDFKAKMVGQEAEMNEYRMCIDICGLIPGVTGDPDICYDCSLQVLEQAISEIKNKSKGEIS